MSILKIAIEVAKFAIRHGTTAGRIATGEATFLSRFPPNVRPFAKDVFRGISIVTTGGIVSDLIKDYISSGGQATNGVSSPKNGSQTYKQNKARSRQSIRYRNRFSSKYCSCAKCRRDRSKRY